MTSFLLPILGGFLLDLLLGDPLAVPHIIRGMGRLITFWERVLRKILPQTEKALLTGGTIIVIIMVLTTGLLPYYLLKVLKSFSPVLSLVVESLIIWQLLATCSLKQASLKVYRALADRDLPLARHYLSQIVGRDTDSLNQEGIVKATIETVAENTADGVIAPLFYIILGGAPLGCIYKGINTMDSMLGYKNPEYIYFGRAAAKLDDIANFLPARLAALLIVIAAFILGYDGKNAWLIFLRDRYNHASPNSAQTEAACAGALGLILGGDAYYFGQLLTKPTIGSERKSAELSDITKANSLLYGSAWLMLILGLLSRFLIIQYF